VEEDQVTFQELVGGAPPSDWPGKALPPAAPPQSLGHAGQSTIGQCNG
jgi:hypothetical protein